MPNHNNKPHYIFESTDAVELRYMYYDVRDLKDNMDTALKQLEKNNYGIVESYLRSTMLVVTEIESKLSMLNRRIGYVDDVDNDVTNG